MEDAIAEFLVNGIANHSHATPRMLAVVIVAALINNVIHRAWSYSEMPRWARAVLGLTMPLALNFYHVGRTPRRRRHT